jgi:hypothetical protein
MDIAKAILDNVEADPRQKALAQHAFEVAPHEHALAPMLTNINIPRDAKADLWNAKRQSMHDPKLTRLAQIAALPKDLLDTAESHPNVTKLLMTEDKEKSEGKSTSPKAATPKEPKAEKPADKEKSSEMSEEPIESQSNQQSSQLPVREPGVSATPSTRNADPDRAYYHDFHVNERGEIVHTPQ